ncbi:hypothetical protein JA1_001956 [Spathaspora sp. JA1]|nr:hypothetical protein JA1_001956 [Spathaspora sp. JA1]
MRWWDLFTIIGRNIRNDFATNIFHRFPLLLIINPDSFQPPFTNGFDEFFNVTTPSIMNNQYSDVIVVNYIIVILSILLAGLDIVYSDSDGGLFNEFEFDPLDRFDLENIKYSGIVVGVFVLIMAFLMRM